MKKLLMEDADELHQCPSKYGEYRHKITTVKYQTLSLNKTQFNNLVFMGTNTTVWNGKHRLVNKLTPEGKPRTLKAVVERIVTEYPYGLPIQTVV